MAKVLISILFLFFSFPSLAQQPVTMDKGLLEVRKEILQRIKGESSRLFLDTKEKERLSEQYNFPLSLKLDQGRTASFQYMDESGKPVYYTTFNINAAITTGAVSMQPGGDLNVGLTGKGMVVGIYDQTRPKANHREFGDRVTQIDGSTEIISNHATHVTGTILATGLNDNARGMVNEATGWAFNWDGDVSKMIQNGYDPELRPGGHIISNHSYGNLVGWYRNSGGNWAWAGNESIDNREDYRFGFYTSKSRQIDELAFSKPYYTVVWAAGNDRGEVGDGTKNADGPEDSLGPEGVAKNNITIGAVNGVRNYSGPSDVVMSQFSSWGPVDDGRIKPDFVSMGVNVFSTAISDEGLSDSYATLSGSSMAAPNATGSLFLLQELYHSRNVDRYMRSATLKGLAIHTTKEAGLSPGPDYMYGWGLLDVDAAARLIINENGTSNIIRELILENNQTYEFDVISNGIEPIKVTIAWTDPAGSSPAPSVDPTNLMLVNDLDIRIIDEEGEIYYPWTLDSSLGSGARGMNDQDNFRDNVEQIVINDPEAKEYTVRVSHKGSLINDIQAFSLIFNAGVSDGQEKTLYWIGGDGDWDSPANWSLESNGASAGIIPDSGTRVVFDQLEQTTSSMVNLSADAEAFSLNFFGNSTVEINLNSNEVTVSNGFRVSNQITSIKNGKLLFHSDQNNESLIDFGTTTLDNIEMVITAGDWKIVSAELLDDVTISNAQVELDVSAIQLAQLNLQAGAEINGRIEEMTFTENINIQENSILNASIKFRFIGANGLFSDFAKNEIPALVHEGQSLQLDQIGLISHLDLNAGEIFFMQATTDIKTLDLHQGVVLNLMSDNQINIIENILHQSTNGSPSIIKAGSKGLFKHEPYKKYCFENIQIENVDLVGTAVVNLGPEAVITNSANWQSLNCGEVLFANFEARFTCEGALVEFTNTTEGPASSYKWTFGPLGSSSEASPSFVFPQEGIYHITLEAISSGKTMWYEKDITIGENILDKPSIVINGSLLTSLVPSSMYQWYRNGIKIEGAEERSFVAEDEGNYQVAVVNESCNRISEPVVISAIEDELPIASFGYFLGPNPTSDRLTVTINNDYFGGVEFEFYATNGAIIKAYKTWKNQTEFVRDLHLNFQPGLYVLLIKTDDLVLTHRIIKK
ncbi:MAG: S8 family serine peptidase [Anditalea sp.]